MLRPRFTVRQLMIAVMIAGIISGVVVLKKRRDHFLVLANTYAGAEEFSLMVAEWDAERAEEAHAEATEAASELPGLALRDRSSSWPGNEYELPPDVERPAPSDPGPTWLDPIRRISGITEAEAAKSRAEAAWYAEMKRKYQRAARYPWLPVGPGPPEPR